MVKSKGANHRQIEARIDKILFWLRQGVSESKIRANLVEQDHISEKTARRSIQAAWELVAGLGSQSTEQQRGLLSARLNHLYNEVSMGEGKNIEQAIKLIALQSKLIPLGGIDHGSPGKQAPSTDLSPELTAALERATLFKDDPESENTHSSA